MEKLIEKEKLMEQIVKCGVNCITHVEQGRGGGDANYIGQ